MKPIVETIDSGPDRSFLSVDLKWHDLEGYMGWHMHPEFEINYLSHGHGTLFVGDNVLEMSAGDLVLIGPNLPISYSEDEHPEEEFGAFMLLFDPAVVFEPISSLPELKNINRLLGIARRGLFFHAIDDSKCIEHLHASVHGDAVTRFTSLLHALDRLSNNTNYSFLVSEGYHSDGSEFDAQKMSRIISHIRQNLATDIIQSDVASALGMTPSSFSRFFKNATGHTFISFLNLVRTSEACKLLNHTDKDITEIAFACGYSNLSNFNRQFRQLRGMTPTDYRRLHQKA